MCGYYSRAATIRCAATIRINTVYIYTTHTHNMHAARVVHTQSHSLMWAEPSMVSCMSMRHQSSCVFVSHHIFSAKKGINKVVPVFSPFMYPRRYQKSRPSAAEPPNKPSCTVHPATQMSATASKPASTTTSPPAPQHSQFSSDESLPQLLQQFQDHCNSSSATSFLPNRPSRARPQTSRYVLLNIIHCYSMCRPRHMYMAAEP